MRVTLCCPATRIVEFGLLKPLMHSPVHGARFAGFSPGAYGSAVKRNDRQ
jgi:hypothetical protein